MSLFGRIFGQNKAAAPEAVSDSPWRVVQSIQDPVDWSNSEIHLMLLHQFLKPTYADSIAREQWEAALGESPQLTLNRYIKNGLLVPLSLKANVEYCNTVADLKKLLKERGLKVSGKKQELAERLVAVDEVGMSKLQASKTVIECSPEIRPRILQYVADKEREFDDAVAGALAALRNMDFEKASRTIGAYESKQIHLPTRGLRIDVGTGTPTEFYGRLAPARKTAADVAAMKEIFTLRPKILRELAESEWKPLLTVVALSDLLSGRLSLEWLPAGFVGVSKFDTAVTVQMMQSHLRYIREFKKLHTLGIRRASIKCSRPNMGSCDACMKVADKIDNPGNLPELPYEKCTCSEGCRCWIYPTLTFDDE